MMMRPPILPRRPGCIALLGLAIILLGARPACPAPGKSPAGKSAAAAANKGKLMLTIVYDNNPFDKRLGTAWGFGCVVRGLEKTMLFDTGGDGRLLLANMAKTGIDPKAIDAVVISHIHADHAGGLNEFLAVNPNVTAYLPKAFPEGIKEATRRAGATLVETDAPTPVCQVARTTRVLGRGIKEQGLALDAADGLVVVTGCAHPGVVAIAGAAKEHAGRPVRAVLGGFHMDGASRAQVMKVVEGLRGLGVRQVAPCHCSGDRTRQVMKEALGEGYLPTGVGAHLTFDLKPTEQP